ncbi:unnamed protein product, partial [Ectocarpus fasciculatus]
RQCLYISGQSGSGKSHYLGRYMKEYRRMFPKNAIYIFSHVEKDAALDSVKGVKRIRFDEAFLEEEWKAEDFADTFCIFDDVFELTQNKQLMGVLTHIRALILGTGRHHRTFYAETSHVTNAGQATKLTLTECSSITLYPHSTGFRTLKYALQTAFGFSTAEIEAIKALPSRWVTVLKTAPRCVLYEGGAYTV